MHLGIIKITYNRTAQPRCYHNAFYGWPFRETRREGNSDFTVIFWASESATLCFVISLNICYWQMRLLFKCVVLACLQIHTSIITVSVRWICFPLGLEVMVKLRTVLTVFTFISKAEARKGELHFQRVLVVFGQSQCTGSAGQSEQTALVGRRDFVENDTFERGGA